MGRGPDLRLLANSLAGTSVVPLQQAHKLLGEAPWLAALLSHPWAASSSNGIATSSSTHASRGPKETLKQHMPRSKVYNKETYEHLRRSRWDLDEMRKVMEQPSSSLGSSAASTSSSSSDSSSSSSGASTGSSSGSGSSGRSSSGRTSGPLHAAIPQRDITRLISEAMTVADIRAVIKQYGASFDAVALSAAITKVPKVAGTQPANGPSMQPPRPPADVERLLDRLVPRLAPLLAVMSVRELSNVLWALSRVGYDPSGEMPGLLWQEVVKGEAGGKLGQANGQELALLTSAAHAWSRRGWVGDEVWHALEDAVVAAAESSMPAAGAASGSTADVALASADVASTSADATSSSGAGGAAAVAAGSSGAKSRLNGRAVSIIASQFTHERRYSHRLVLSLANWAAVPENAATMSAKELAEFMGALAVTPGLMSEVVGSGVLGVLSRAAAEKVWDASMNQLGRMAGAVGTYGGPLLLLEAIAGRLEHMTRSDGMGGDSSVLGSSGSSSTSTAIEAATSSSSSSSSSSETRTIPGVPAALSKIAWATAQLGGPPRPILLRAAADRLAACPSEFSPAEATYVLSAAAKLSDVAGFELNGWWAEVGRSLVPVLGTFSLRHVAMVAYAVSVSGQPLDASPKPLLAAIAVEAERRAIELDARIITTIMCAFEKLRYAEGVRAAAKLGAVLEQLRRDGRASDGDVVRAVKALEGLGVKVPGLLLRDVGNSQQQQQQHPQHEEQEQHVAGTAA